MRGNNHGAHSTKHARATDDSIRYVLEVDSRAHNERWRENPFQVGSLFVVRVRVVRWQKRAALQRASLCQLASTNHSSGVGRVVELRTNLTGVY
jgi:hypothetical protein